MERVMNTKMFAAAAALAMLIASPALAQTADQPRPGARPAPDRNFNLVRPGPRQPIIDDQTDGRRHSPNPAFDVYLGGRYLGSDPDPNVRLELRRDTLPAD
jgi:hypothetical protein